MQKPPPKEANDPSIVEGSWDVCSPKCIPRPQGFPHLPIDHQISALGRAWGGWNLGASPQRPLCTHGFAIAAGCEAHAIQICTGSASAQLWRGRASGKRFKWECALCITCIYSKPYRYPIISRSILEWYLSLQLIYVQFMIIYIGSLIMFITYLNHRGMHTLMHG